MKRLCRLLACNLLLACLLPACSTPGIRERAHPAAVRRLSPADQQLVRHGRIRPGMSQEAVYIAWGSPDEKTTCSDKSAPVRWIYRQRVTMYEPMNAYYYSGPYHGFGADAAGRGFLPPYAYGGVGYEDTLRYQPHVRSLDSVRIAEFSGGTVDRYKEANGAWSRRSPAEQLTARRAERRLPQVARHPVQSRRHLGEVRLALHHHRISVVHSTHAADTHRLQRTHHLGGEKNGGVRTASGTGSKAGMERPGSHRTHPGRGVHHPGHAHGGLPRAVP